MVDDLKRREDDGKKFKVTGWKVLEDLNLTTENYS